MDAAERFNSISHLVGIVLAVFGTGILVGVSLDQNNPLKLTALLIYGAMLIMLYVSSTLYHTLQGRAKRVFHVLDHCSIYLLIAGTYTPLTLVTLRGASGRWLFGVVWALALIGVAKDVFLRNWMRWLSVVLYVLMGWLVVLAIRPLRLALPWPGIEWLLVGGLLYTAGIVFYARKNTHSHGIWHIFALLGSVCHYLAVLFYVAVVPAT